MAAGVTFGRLVELWLADALPRCGKAEAASLRSIAGRAARQLGDVDADAVSADTVQAYLRALARDGLKTKGHLRVMRRVLGHAERAGVLATNPLTGVRFDDIGNIVVRRPVATRRRKAPPTQRSPWVRSDPIPAQPKPAQPAQTELRSGTGWLEFRLGDPVPRAAAARPKPD